MTKHGSKVITAIVVVFTAVLTMVTGQTVAQASVDSVVGESNFAAPAAGEPRARSTSACTDPKFALGLRHVSGRWDWSYNPAGTPASVSTTALAAIRTGTTSAFTGHNDCGIAVSLPISERFKETTTLKAQISDAGVCTGNDHVNVTSWGVLPPGVLATTCTYGNVVTGSDTKLSIGAFNWFTGALPANCVGRWDLESVIVHERGHTIGLEHVDQATHSLLTMSKRTLQCTTYKRTLGLGDVRGLVAATS